MVGYNYDKDLNSPLGELKDTYDSQWTLTFIDLRTNVRDQPLKPVLQAKGISAD